MCAPGSAVVSSSSPILPREAQVPEDGLGVPVISFAWTRACRLELARLFVLVACDFLLPVTFVGADVCVFFLSFC